MLSTVVEPNALDISISAEVQIHTNSARLPTHHKTAGKPENRTQEAEPHGGLPFIADITHGNMAPIKCTAALEGSDEVD